MAVFFNLFVAEEPYAGVKVTHGTPCIDPWFQRRMRGWSYISLAGHWEQSRPEDDKADKDHQYKIWPHLVGSSMLLYLTKHDGRGVVDGRLAPPPT